MKKMKLPVQALLTVWEDNFRKDTNKFIKATYLEPEDLGKEFTDREGVTWKILGSMEGKDMPCQKVGTNEVEIWDRWKVSQYVRPEKHAKALKKVEFTHSSDKKKKERGSLKKIDLSGENTNNDPQLKLFES